MVEVECARTSSYRPNVLVFCIHPRFFSRSLREVNQAPALTSVPNFRTRRTLISAGRSPRSKRSGFFSYDRYVPCPVGCLCPQGVFFFCLTPQSSAKPPVLVVCLVWVVFFFFFFFFFGFLVLGRISAVLPLPPNTRLALASSNNRNFVGCTLVRFL